MAAALPYLMAAQAGMSIYNSLNPPKGPSVPVPLGQSQAPQAPSTPSTPPLTAPKFSPRSPSSPIQSNYTMGGKG